MAYPWNKWDVRFLRLAKFVSSWSKDPSTKAGAVIVRPDRSVVSMGFNGFARTMEDNPERYLDREEKYSRIIHCEVNALIQARTGVQGCSLYTWPFMCCDRCVVQMLQAGIVKFVYPQATSDALTRWSEAFKKTESFMAESRVSYIELTLEAIEKGEQDGL